MPGARRAGLLAVLCVGLAYASLPQGIGWNQNAHFALVRSLSHGTAVIDRYRGETGDVAWYRGHYYSTKAPGLAFLTVGPYFVMNKVGLVDAFGRLPGVSSPHVGTLWALGLFGCVLPALLTLLVVRRIGNDLEPGAGAAAAVSLGLGTLLLPFATLFFDHALSTALGFAAFALLWFGRAPLWRVAAAGLLAGLAITSEYPLGLVALAVLVYALAQGDVLRRGGAYVAGLAVGVTPLLAYNWWAFGSPTHLSYEHAVFTGGASGHDVLGANDPGLFGVGWPSFHQAVRLLLSKTGLVTLSPIVAAGAAGVVLLWRRGRRLEAGLIGGLAVAFVIYNSGYFDPFGGWSPGPRFLIPILPFLALGIALAYRAWPLATFGLTVVSALLMLAVTATGPVLAHDGLWYERIRSGTFSGHGLWPNLPLLVLAAAAVALDARARRLPRPTARDWRTAGAALAGWTVVALAAPRLLPDSAALAALLAVAVAAAVVAVHAGPGVVGLSGTSWPRRAYGRR